jgi:5'-3' exoribonuclease 2
VRSFIIGLTTWLTIIVSRKHIPEVFHDLMTNEESPIIDFYPDTFQIDMNGKKMLWQGVALLPFIDEKRLLEAMAEHYPKLSEDEIRRNSWGHDVILVSDEHSLYPFFEGLYGKRKEKQVRRQFDIFRSRY